MPGFRKETAVNLAGWSRWIQPVQGYRMACCDCGLVHELEFEVLKVTFKSGMDFDAEVMPWGDYRLNLRARRHSRSTAQIRRHMKAKEDAADE